MKEFIINNIEIISTIIGVIVFIVMTNIFNYVQDTKFEELHKWYFFAILIVGVVVSSQAIGKWIIK